MHGLDKNTDFSYLIGLGGIVIVWLFAVGLTASPVKKEIASVKNPTQVEQKEVVLSTLEQSMADGKMMPVSTLPTVKRDVVNVPVIKPQPNNPITDLPTPSSRQNAVVVNVVDGDTVTVMLDGVRETVRIIGINTSETVDPRKSVECFGAEASTQAKKLLDDKIVQLEADTTQGDRDKYKRLLRYIFFTGGTDFGKQMIVDGYAYEYTYATPYKYQKAYKMAQNEAQITKRGLWSTSTCNGQKTTSSSTNTNVNSATPSVQSSDPSTVNSVCNIKGNISTTREKIYHLPACKSYSKTVIDTSQGERLFCSEQEALGAGWRKALNCP